jgi:type VI secretion system protein VasG
MNLELKSLIGRLSPISRSALEAAAQLCVRQTNFNVEIEHLFRTLLDLDNGDIHHILRNYDIEVSDVAQEFTLAIERFPRGNSRTPAFSPNVPRLLQDAWVVSSLLLEEPAVRSGSLLLAALENDILRNVMRESSPSLLKIPREALRDNLRDLISLSAEAAGAPRAAPKIGQPLAQSQPSAAPRAAGAPQGASGTTALDQYTIDLTAQAREGKIDPIRGRDQEIRQIIDILMRRRQNNPILTGEAGVGKTAVVEGFAQRVADGDVPESMRNAAVRALDLGLLQAGAGMKGEFEHRLKSVIEEVKSSAQPIILFIDEAHTLIGAGGAQGQGDAANLLKPALARGELRTIAATTWSEYKKYVEKDPALARRFQVIKVEEPDEENAVSMLRGVVPQLEIHHGVRVLEEALRDAVKLSHRHIPGRQLPDKAVSVLDTACARVAIAQASPPPVVEGAARRVATVELELGILRRENLSTNKHTARIRDLERELETNESNLREAETRWQGELTLVKEIGALRKKIEDLSTNEANKSEVAKLVTQIGGMEQKLAALQDDAAMVPTCVDSQIIASVISDWTGIPVGKMVKDEIRTVMNLQTMMQDRIIGQSEALDVICRRIRTFRAHLDDPVKPVGVFLLVGPSGVGKTETAITLADYLYGGERNMITVNMSEYQEAHTVSGLKGSPPGYVGYGTGGVLTEAVRRRPYSVVLLDEIEKAHPDVIEMFYQVFDKGSMEDAEGSVVDFKNAIILLTSNVGSETILKACARKGTRPDYETLVKLIRPELLEHFKPALLGRLFVVPYYPLHDEEVTEIVELKLSKIQQRFWEQHQADLTYDPAVVQLIVGRCTEVDSGARNIDHIITQSMLPELSTQVLEQMARGTTFTSAHISIDGEGKLTYTLGSLPSELQVSALEPNVPQPA